MMKQLTFTVLLSFSLVLSAQQKQISLEDIWSNNTFRTESIASLRSMNSGYDYTVIEFNEVVSEGWAKGGEGSKELAKVVVNIVENKASQYKPLYDWKSPVTQKIECIAKEIYGASSVEYSKKAQLNLKRIDRLGFNDFAICMAKTQKSFSDNQQLVGRPEDFTVTVREIEIAAGAQFIIPILGKMMRMPGLPSKPASEGMTIDKNGVISGLS